MENHGADPDILLDNDPASVMAGRDLQLDKAIEVVLKKITRNPSRSRRDRRIRRSNRSEMLVFLNCSFTFLVPVM